MIRLNLLRERRVAKPKSLMWQFWLYLVVVLITLGGVGAVWFFQSKELEKLAMEKARLDAEIKTYEKYDKLLKELQAKLDDVKKRTEVITTLVTDRDDVVRLIALMAILVPEENMWFEEIRFAGGSVNLSGFAKSNETIVEFMRNLEASYFVPKEETNLIRSRSEEYVGNILRKFELSFKYNKFSSIAAAIKKQDGQK